jgi:hypothetical protein
MKRSKFTTREGLVMLLGVALKLCSTGETTLRFCVPNLVALPRAIPRPEIGAVTLAWTIANPGSAGRYGPFHTNWLSLPQVGS